jgi:type I restriction enzyme M protein
VRQPDKLDPFLLLALLNTPIVRRQMRSKQFTRDIIDTLGKRLFEVVLPVPKRPELRKRIADETRNVIETRVALRNRAKEIVLEIEGTSAAADVEEV